jgi:hypothetical protein
MGVVKQGSVKVYYQLKIMPSGEDIVVKSIQMHDDPVDESNSPARIGLAVKGMIAEQIAKGDIHTKGRRFFLSCKGSITGISSRHPLKNSRYRVYEKFFLQRRSRRESNLPDISRTTNKTCKIKASRRA